ncbi:hypothetical protein MMC08_005396 [Hypocenomyce scalaris]|nr:hypothetical protein [Hypocenomyce scalaris]
MSSYRPVEDRSGPGDTYRPLPAQARGDRNGRMYEEQNSRPHSKDQSRRSTPSPRRYTPPHDRSRTSPHGAARSPNNTAGRREWDVRRERDNAQDHDDYNRGRPMSSRRGEKAGYRDRDREGYRSPRYYSRSRSGSPRRDRSPFYGGPPSREVMLEGIPLEMVEDDVGHHLPTLAALKHPYQYSTGLSVL